MGTRADFYVGTGSNAEWIGSIAWDGYEWHEDTDTPIMQAANEQDFRDAVSDMLNGRDDATRPSQGWPWPWDDSCTTDFTYAYSNGKVTPYSWGAEILDDEEEGIGLEWPNMKEKASNPVIGAKRSGVMVLSR